MRQGNIALSPEDVAQGIELRTEGLSWGSIAYLLGKAAATTWQNSVRRAELLGFAAWPEIELDESADTDDTDGSSS